MTSLTATRYNPISQHATTEPRTLGVPADQGKWEAWFGPMPQHPQPSPFSHYPVEHKTLPDAYLGVNVFLAEKISGLINTTGDFWTSRLLPWQQSQHIGPFTWSEWNFNQVIASRLPHEGVPRLVTVSEKTFVARPIRRGLAAEFEADFVNTTKGQITMARKIQGMVVSTQTTVNQDVQHTILMANEQRKADFQRVGTTRVPISMEIDIEIDAFNAIGKSPSGFVALTSKVRRYLMNSQAEPPFVLLVTPETPMDMALNALPQPQPYRLVGGDVLRGAEGELGSTRVPDGDFVLPDGTSVIEVKDLNIDVNAPPEQMFTRNVLIGEWYSINWAEMSKANLYDGCGSTSSHTLYCSDHRSILIHNAETDQMAKISLLDCLIFGGRDTAFPDMNIVKMLAQRPYKMDDFYPSSKRNDGDRDERRNQGSNMKRTPHMMLFFQKDNGTRIVRHFGNMDSNVTSDNTFRQIGQTLAGKVVISDGDKKVAEDMVSLMQELEEAEYNDSFFQALIEVNLPFSMKEGEFVGEKLDDRQLIDKFGIDANLIEWTPQEHGGLKVPPRTTAGFADITVPPGLASLAGLYGLAREPSWGKYSTRAAKAIRLLRRVYNKWNKCLASEAFRADNRAPWFHKPDGLYTFFDNVVYMPRDPLFLAAPGIRGGFSAETRGPGALVSRTTGIPEFDRVYNVDSDLSSSQRFAVFKQLTTQSLGNGGADVTRSSQVDPIYAALFKMGETSGPALAGIMTDLGPELRRKFAKVIIDSKSQNMRNLVIGIDRSEESNAAAVEFLLSKGTTKKARAAKIKQYETLAKGEDDPDVAGFDNPMIYRRIHAAEVAGAGGAGAGAVGGAGGIEPNFSDAAVADAPLYRSPLVMTPGLARTIGHARMAAPLVHPSDPESGHTRPLDTEGGAIPDTVLHRPQYATFVGEALKNRRGHHTTWGGHHWEFLAAQNAGRAVSGGARSTPEASSRSGGGNMFDASFGDGELFEEQSVVEAISATLRRGAGSSSRVGARSAYAWKDPDTDQGWTSRTSRFDRKRPFEYLGRALVGHYEGGIKDIDDSDGHRLIFEFDTDNMREHIAVASRIADNPVVRWGSLAVLLARCDNPDHWQNMVNADVLVPCNALLLRFRQEFLTDSFVMMKPGESTGGTLFNQASSMIGWDVIVRRLHLNFAFYSKAMVWNPKNIYVMENAQVRRYVRGRGIRFITNIDQIATDSADEREYYDMVSVIVPIEENKHGNHRSGIGILGDSQAGQPDRNNAIDPTRMGVDYSSAEYVKLWFTSGSEGLSLEEIMRDSHRVAGRFLESQDALPPLLYQGHQQNYNHSDRRWSVFVYGRGHLGRNGSYPGVIEVYNRTPNGGIFLDPHPDYPTNVS